VTARRVLATFETHPADPRHWSVGFATLLKEVGRRHGLQCVRVDDASGRDARPPAGVRAAGGRPDVADAK
jgi:hypothetical protein